jgi:mono/diheme cytochrome c family protein
MLDGAQVLSTPLSDGNSFTCSTCHSLGDPSSDGIRRPGHEIGDATRRSAWKNGKAHTFLEAVNSCVTEWMVAPAWNESDRRYLAVHDYLDAQAKLSSAPNLTFEIATTPADLSGGDAAHGRSLFNQTCIVCHGADGVGTLRGPSIAGSPREPAYIATRVRRSGSSTSPVYDGLTGGVMPFWAKDRLSDAELRDLIAFIKSPAAASGPDSTGDAGGASGSAGSSDCATRDPHVGWIADLGVNMGEGQVSGKVAIVDDCTLELRDFSYDGNGIDVHVYGAKNQSFAPGFIIGDDLFGKVFKNQTLRVTLPADKTLADLSWVGIWCIPAKANFGSGQFKAP